MRQILPPPVRPLRRRTRGFTLLEIMLVVTIIMLLLGAGVYFLGDQINIGRNARVQADLQSLTTNIRTYQMMNGFYPTTQQGLQALVVMPNSEPKPKQWVQLATKIPQDPWGNDYVYVCPGKHNPKTFDIYTKGPDRVAETEDDMGNWDK
jgi:general secretion pathway protein G